MLHFRKAVVGFTLAITALARKNGSRFLAFEGRKAPFPGCIEGLQPFDFRSADGDMRVAEERLEAASDIHFRT